LKLVLVGIGIAIIIGTVAVIPMLGTTPEPEPPVINRVIEKEPEPPKIEPVIVKEPEPELPVIQQVEKEPELQQAQITSYSDKSETDCSGNARCFSGVVTSVIDGDTIRVNDHSIRFTLSSAPELDESNGQTAQILIDTLCPVGSEALVDEDDDQTQGSYGRILAVVYCNGVNLNEELLDSGVGYLLDEFCDDSEFASMDWAKKHGCQEEEPKVTVVGSDCDESYPDFCIPSPPPDLDCKDIPQKKFTVLQPDPHRFDGDKDGIGCES